jgi:hypothetical protein
MSEAAGGHVVCSFVVRRTKIERIANFGGASADFAQRRPCR